MTKGWLARGLENAKRDAQRFPEDRRKALVSDREFRLEPAGRSRHSQQATTIQHRRTQGKRHQG